MSIRQIKTFPDECLRKKARPVSKINQDIKTLIDDMIETMRDAPGVGLAAPQVGVSERVVVIEFGDEEDENIPKQLYALINPEVLSKSDEIVNGVEGCLSLPGLVGEVERSESVVVRAMNQHGDKVKIRAEGWLARVFQHEIDHLDGVLYIDRASKIWQPDPEEMESIPD
jgi:peptide deformylase